jgi:hypothetical protein
MYARFSEVTNLRRRDLVGDFGPMDLEFAGGCGWLELESYWDDLEWEFLQLKKRGNASLPDQILESIF